ncbi:hypothetical protein PV762_26965 [Mitsuaria sp. CC2]|uniref:hypothetical protein n=1 Tax=Mitsuaria sp. CC2 TaxID=3029186 RepID=UPI003B8E1070
MRHTISLQYMKPEDSKPSAGYEFTDSELELPDGGTVPRVGEFIQLVTDKSTTSYVVLAVHTRIFLADPKIKPGWHSYVTVGPVKNVPDPRLLAIRE